MYTGEPARHIAAAILVLPLILNSSISWGQDEGEQRLTEGVIIGPIIDNNIGDQGVFNPDFESGLMEPDYTTLVPPAPGRDLKDVATAPGGNTVLLDGDWVRVYDALGNLSDEFDCTELPFDVTKNNGQVVSRTLSGGCSALTVLLDGTYRIAGRIGNGGGPEIIGYAPNAVPPQTTLKASETPPEVTAIVGDLAEITGAGQVYYWVGERKKIGKSVYNSDLNVLEPFEVIATLNGKRIDDITTHSLDRVIVVTDAGELFQVYVSTGAVQQFAVLDTGALCGLGNKDPQAFSLSSVGGRLFVSNRGCNTITIYNDQDPPQQVQNVANNPLELTNPDVLYPERLEVFAGRPGNFGLCGDTEATGCPTGLVPDGGVMWGITTVNPEVGPEGSVTAESTVFAPFSTEYIEFEFVVPDCRLTDPMNCPIENPGAQPEEWILDLMQLWLQTDDGPVLRLLLYGDGPVEKVLLPGYLTAQTRVPRDSATPPVDCGRDPDPLPTDCINVDPEIISIVIVTEALFTGTFFVDYRLEQFLPEEAFDACMQPLELGSTVGQANEVYPPIIYHSTDEDGTIDRLSVDRGVVLPGEVPGTRGGYTTTNLCNDRGSVPRWSSNTFNVEFTDPAPDALVLQAHRMAGELGMVINDLICDSFAPGLDPLLDPSGSDCAALKNETNQIFVKFDVCIKSLFDPDGNSMENCNALDTKTTNLKARIDAADWPDPFDPDNVAVLKPNYQGELESRLAAFVFFVQNFVVKAVPQDGNGIPGEPPPQLPPLLLN